MGFSVRELFEGEERFFEFSHEAMNRVQELMHELEIVFYSYGLHTPVIPADISEENACQMKHVLLGGDYVYDIFSALQREFHDENMGFEDMMNFVEQRIDELADCAKIFKMLEDVVISAQESVSLYCPHAGPSDAFWMTSRAVFESAKEYQIFYAEMLERGTHLLMRLKYVLKQYQEIAELY